jgi:histidinol phosphatase-like PHP family hydrolase
MKPQRPSEIDLHLHAGQERDMPLEGLVKTFVDQGISFLGLLDHSELYQMGDEALKAKFGQLVYHATPQGLRDFYAEVDELGRAYAGQACIFKGIELPEWEILFSDSDLLELTDFVGCHLNTSCHDPAHRHYVNTSCGEHLANRASQLLKVCEPLGKPAVLFHPFHRRVQELGTKVASGGTLESEEVFTDEDIGYLLEKVDVENLYVELNFGDIFTAAATGGLLEILGRTCRALKAGGIGFSLGSDYHRTPEDFRDPDPIVARLGLTLKDLTLIRRLQGP